jgi:hypothetical protein
MPIHFVIRQNGQASQVSEGTTNALENASNVIFAVRSDPCSSPDASKEIANAVSMVYNCWCIENGKHFKNATMLVRAFDDNAENSDDYAGENLHYVYAYGYCPNNRRWHRDKIFYVGMGQGDRYIQHLNPPAHAHPIEHGKIAKIEAALGPAPWNGREAAVVRHVAAFSGAYAAEQAAAVEHFLITHYFGVYRLTNRTGGNNQHAARSDRWLALPKGITSFEEWRKLLAVLVDGGEPARKQTQQRGLTARALNAQVQWTLGDLTNGNRSLVRANPDGDVFISDGTDVAADYLLKYGDQPAMRVQLRMSDQDASFCINLRPLRRPPDTTKELWLEGFTTLIARMFFCNDENTAMERIRAPHNPYFKPCAPRGKGRRDIDFELSNPDKMYEFVETPLFENGTWACLREVLLKIVSRIPDQALVCGDHADQQPRQPTRQPPR